MTGAMARVGVVGCGKISGIYFQNGKILKNLDIVACADLILERAQSAAEEHGISKVCSVDELLNDPDIDIVLNLTIPAAHFDVSMRALNAGKSVYSEKPLTITREQGRELLDLAQKKNLLVGCAPDTFLGAGIQTCRKLIDDGWIGEPVAATAFFSCRGHERWYPNCEFFYQPGGGPAFDMGPYYITALVNLVGPVKHVSGMVRKTFPERTITCKNSDKFGKKIPVEIPTHITGALEFANGALGTIITSFDIWKTSLPYVEIHGTEGSISVPDPNTFGGTPLFCRSWKKEWEAVPLTHGYAENTRGLGLADMACALHSGRRHRANGDLAYHVLDITHALHDSAVAGKHVAVESTCERPAPLPLGLVHGMLDE